MTARPVMGGVEWLLLIALTLLWGGSFFFTEVALAGLPPFTVVLGRVGPASSHGPAPPTCCWSPS